MPQFYTDQQVRDHAQAQGLHARSTEQEIRAAFPDLPAESEVFGPEGRLRMVDGIPGWVSPRAARLGCP